MSEPGVVLFIDNSNIFISGGKLAETRDGKGARLDFRLEFEHLIELALSGRTLLRAYVVGSIPPEERAVWDRLAEVTGVQPELFERGADTGKEQGVDQCLQVNMLRAVSDYSSPQIATLLTGDGSGYDDGAGFHADLERMHNAGWGIEVLSWQGSCKKALRQWAEVNGIFVPLDDHYDSISFIKNKRRSKGLDLSSRKVASTNDSPSKAAERKVRAEELAKQLALQKKISELESKLSTKERRKQKHNKRFSRGKGQPD